MESQKCWCEDKSPSIEEHPDLPYTLHLSDSKEDSNWKLLNFEAKMEEDFKVHKWMVECKRCQKKYCYTNGFDIYSDCRDNYLIHRSKL
jgi:hypothetical protein